MPPLYSGISSDTSAVSRPMVLGLFVASCLLSIVSWYTTQQGMALSLSPWLSVAASLGVQSALVLVAWLIGFTKSSRALLVAVYAITATGPYFFGAPEQRWAAGGAALDSVDRLTFMREFLRKLTPDAQGMARAGVEALSPGEQQFCLLLLAKGLATSVAEDKGRFYVLDHSVQEELLEAVAAEKPPLRASLQRAPMRA